MLQSVSSTTAEALAEYRQASQRLWVEAAVPANLLGKSSRGLVMGMRFGRGFGELERSPQKVGARTSNADGGNT